MQHSSNMALSLYRDRDFNWQIINIELWAIYILWWSGLVIERKLEYKDKTREASLLSLILLFSSISYIREVPGWTCNIPLLADNSWSLFKDHGDLMIYLSPCHVNMGCCDLFIYLFIYLLEPVSCKHGSWRPIYLFEAV